MLYNHFRNYGCRLNTNYFYKDLRLAVLENEYLRISILVDKGTDIFEFLYKPKDIDFMWQSPWGINTPSKFVPTIESKEGNFMDYYEGGWQEILPNFGFGTNYYKGAEEGLHGETCLLPWDYQVLENNPAQISIKFNVRTYRTPFFIEKILTLKKDDPRLYISEKLKNEGYSVMDYMWTHHPTFGGRFLDDSTVIDVPDSKVKMMFKGKNNVGSLEEIKDPAIKWPKIPGYSGAEIDFSKSPTIIDSKTESTDELGLGDLKDGWYAVTNLNEKVGFGMKWDNKVFPYIWIWRMYGKGYQGAPWFGRVYCMALEICSGISPDSLKGAVENNTAKKIEPGQVIQTNFTAIAYEKSERVNGINEKNDIF